MAKGREEDQLDTAGAIIEVGCVYLTDPRVDQLLWDIPKEVDVGSNGWIAGYLVQIRVHTVAVVVAIFWDFNLLTSELDLCGRPV